MLFDTCTCSDMSVTSALLFPCMQVTGMVAEEASLFKSALMPARFCFKTVTNETYTVSMCMCVGIESMSRTSLVPVAMQYYLHLLVSVICEAVHVQLESCGVRDMCR